MIKIDKRKCKILIAVQLIFLFILNNSFTTIAIDEFYVKDFNKTNIGISFSDRLKKICKSTDGGFYTAEDLYMINNEFPAKEVDCNSMLSKFNEAGTLVWSKKINNAIQIININNGVMLIENNEGSKIIFKNIDSNGNLRDMFELSCSFSSIEYIIKTSDSGYILIGMMPDILDKTDYISLLKVDITGSQEWFSKTRFKKDQFNFINIKETPKGEISIIGATNNTEFNDLKLDSFGQIISEKTFKVKDSFNISNVYRLNDGYLININNNLDKYDLNGNLIWTNIVENLEITEIIKTSKEFVIIGYDKVLSQYLIKKNIIVLNSEVKVIEILDEKVTLDEKLVESDSLKQSNIDSNNISENIDMTADVIPSIELTLDSNTIDFGEITPIVKTYSSELNVIVNSNTDYSLSFKIKDDLYSKNGDIIPISNMSANINYKSEITLSKNDSFETILKKDKSLNNIKFNLNTDWDFKPGKYQSVIELNIKSIN